MDKNKIINLISLFIYAAFTLTILLHHEVWADEAQVWLVVRDLDIWGILNHVRTEGHPLLWYFWVLPLAKLNLGIVSMQVLNWVVMAVAVGVFLWKSPFSIFCKVSVLLSSAFLYWFPVISRSYCLIPLLIFLLAWFYKKQKEHPFLYALLLILLSNTHVIVFGFCGALAFLFFYGNVIKDKNKKAILPFCLMGASLLAIIFYLSGSQNENVIVQTFHPDFSVNGIKNVYLKVVFNLFGQANVLNILGLAISGIVCAGILFFNDKKMFFVFVTNLIYQSVIFIFVWSILPQRAFVLFLVGMFCLWVCYEKLKTEKQKIVLNIILALMFLFSVPEGVKLIEKDFKHIFSDGKNTANFIKQNIPEDAFFVSNYPITTTSVSAYLPKGKRKFYYDGYKDKYTYTIWNKPIPLSFTPLPLMRILSEHETVYVIMSAGAFYEDVRPIYSSSEDVLTNQEKFNIYKFEGFKSGK